MKNKEWIAPKGKIWVCLACGKTAAWHVHYYRKMIRDAEKTIERAKERLDAAKMREKEKMEDK